VRQAILDRLSRSPPGHCPHCGCCLIRRPSKLLPK